MWWSKGKSQVTEGTQALASPLIMSLEPRMLFDGAVAATVADAAQPDAHATDAAKPSTTDQASDSHAPQGQTDATQAAVPGEAVLFVDSRVRDSASLLDGLAPGTLVVELDGTKDGLQQIADYLQSHQGVSSVQIIAHGNAGDLWLGNSYLSADNIQARSEVLAQIGQNMNVGGDILIYGCYTAEGDRGLSLVESLAQLTGRDVAASDDRTGMGGDWELEIAVGNIESANVLSTSAMSEYDWGLATWTATNNFNSGVGSLRAALASAQNGDIVTFNANMTVALTQVLVVDKNVTIDGDLNNDNVADVTLDGQYRTQIINVTAGTTATLDGLVITRGVTAGNGGNGGDDALVSKGGGIYNAGTLTLRNVTVTANAASGGGGGGGVTPQYAGGGGGGGGAITGGTGGRGGDTLNSLGSNGSSGQGGAGGGFFNTGGRGGSSTGGAGGAAYPGYSTGSAGGTASSGGLSIGGGGGGDGYNDIGGAGGGAVGGIYNDTGATLRVIGNTVISNNVGAGGGGGGGGAGGSYNQAGGAGGVGVGAIWNKGTILMTAANFGALAGNVGGSGTGGTSAGTAGVSPAPVNNIYVDGGTLDINYVPDETPPTASIVVANTSLDSAATSLVTITFSEPVTDFTNADLTIANGTLSNVSSSDGGITWTATLTAASNITDTTNVITLNNAGVQDAAGNAGVGTTNSNNYTVNDTVPPSASIVVADTALRIGETSLVTITFSEAVSGFTAADLTVANGTITGLSSSDGGVIWTATLTPNAAVTDTTNLVTLNNTGVADLNGNAGVGTTDSNNYAIDTLRPTATITVADTALSIGETSLVTITFSEAVTGFTNADLTIANGTLSAISSSDGGITWTATLTPNAPVTDTTNLVTLDNTGVIDLNGNPGVGTTDSNNYAIDTLRPTATIVVADSALSAGETSLVTITFNEAVSGFTTADLTVANGTITGLSSSDGGITWTATLTPSASTTDTTNLITLDNTGIADASGNVGTGTTDSNNYAIDTLRPTASIVVADTALSIGETSLVTITFSEAVTGFTLADLSVANGSLSGLSSSDGGITWTATLTPSASTTDATNQIVLTNSGVADAAGNAGTGTTSSNNYAVDTQRPIATIVVADTALSVGETSLVTITFSEAVSGFTLADLNVANGSLSALSSSDGGITWTATLTPSASTTDATNLITLDNTGISDAAGNAGTGTTDSNNYAVDTQRPTATIVVADTALNIGETSLVTITFSEAVTGFTNADLTIANGTLSAISSSDGGITWTATLTPSASTTDATNLITLDNTGISDAAGNAGSGTTDSNNYAVDTLRPTVSIVVADTALNIGETSLVTITFSEAVAGFTLADLNVVNGSLSGLSSSDGGITWTATLTPSASTTDATNLITLDNTGVSDLAGNAGTGSTDSNNYAIDTLRPTASIVVADTALNIGETSLVTITFSEAVTGFTLADLNVVNGSLSGLSSSDGGITWTATLTPSASTTDATNLITLDNTGISDAAGNTGPGTTDSNNYAVDTLRPTATIVVADTSLNSAATSLVTITFSEPVTGFTNADLTIANGTLSNVSSSDGGITWTATLTAASNLTDTTNVITLNNTGVQDAAGNAGVGATNSNNYTVNDTVPPTASIVVADSALRIGEMSLVTITFSEAVSGFTAADLTVANGTVTGLSSSDGGVTWTATLTTNASVTDTTNLVTLNNNGVADLNGNAGVGTTDSNNYAIDTLRPTATITVADTALNIGETSLVTITFSEAVTGFTLADLNVVNGSLSGLSSSDGGITWTATLTPSVSTTDATNLITLDNTGISDAAGNTGTGTTDSNSYAVDTQRPTANIVVADTALNIGETSLVTITFSEAVTGFTLADLNVVDGSLSGLSSSDGGITWTATLTPSSSTTDATNLITLDNTGISDAAGNTGPGTTDSNNYAVDTQPPTASIVVADTSLNIGETSLVTITFSEAVSGFDNSDLTVNNGTLSTLSSSDGGVTWTATFTPDASVSDTTNLITLDNTGISDAAGNTGTGTTDSNNYAVDTQRPTANIVVADTALNLGDTSLVTITFSEAVSGFDNSGLTVKNGTLSTVSSSDGGITWTATFTPAASVSDTTNLITLDNTGISDAAGNTGSGTTDSNNYAVDTLRPTASIVVADTALNIGETSLVTITFSEAVTDFTLTDLNVVNGSLSGLSSSDGGITWTATLTPSANTTDASNQIVLANTGVADAAGNVGTGTTDSNNYAVDTQRPTATIVVADTALNIGETSLVTITFSEAVTGFTLADLNVVNGSLSGLSSSDGGITWTATLTPSASTTDATSLITLDNTGISDAAGNTGTGTTDSNNYAVDTQRPTASIALADTALNIGETSLVTITFSEAVSGFDNSDLSVANGTLSAVSSSDGGITWTAIFTPAANTRDATNLITLDNTGVSDAAGNNGTGTTDSGNYAIDTQRPTATIVIADTSLIIGETSLVTITFSEAVSGFDNSDLTVSSGTLSTMSSTDGGVTWTATFTPSSNISDTSNVITLDNTGLTNIAGNAGVGTTDSNNYAVDTVRPTATIIVADTAIAAGETSLVTITFSEAITGFTIDDLTVANGVVSGLSSSDGGITWTATFTPTNGITNTGNLITLNAGGIADMTGNINIGTTSSNNYAIDTQRPTATIVVADTALSVGETSLVTITFSEPVTGFTLADLSVVNGILSGLSSSDGGITWTATLTPSASTTDATNLITLDNTGISDLPGNAGTGSTDSNNFAIDTLRPTATIVVADTALSVGDTSLVTITFSEAVSGFDNSDLTVNNGTLSTISSSDGGITWTATFTPTASVNDTTNLITLDNTGISDAAGNTGSGTTDSNNYAIDTLRPTATIVVADSTLSIGETSQVTITFSEAVTGFTLADLSVVNGSLSGLSSSDGGITWTATLTPSASTTDATNQIVLANSAVADAAGNAGTGTTSSNNYAVDTQRPAATIVVTDTSLIIGETSLVTITFSEAVGGFDNSDLTVSNGTLSTMSSTNGGVTWTATFTPSSNISDTNNVITLDNTGVVDLNGNLGDGATDSNNYVVDTIRPGARITLADTRLGIGQTTTVTITFTEAVTGFDLSDLSVANGVLSNLASTDGGLTWAATLTPSAGVDDATNLILLDSSNVQDIAGNAGAGIAISANYALDATRPTATIVVADPNLSVGETTQVTITFSEAVNDFDLSDLRVTNGELSNLSSSDGGLTWTATFTPTADLTDPSNLIDLDTNNVRDLAGNVGASVAVSNNYAIDTVVNDVKPPPEFLTSNPVTVSPPTEVPLQPIIFSSTTGNLGSPLGFPPLFEQRDVGGGIRPIGDIFISRGALAPSFIAQVFSGTATGNGTGQGFLGFGGGDGGVFGSSTIAGLFSQDFASESDSLDTFGNQSMQGGDMSQGLPGLFGAPTLGQQLQHLKDTEQRQVNGLAAALKQVGVSQVQA